MTATPTTRLANLRDVAHGLPDGTLREGQLLRSDAPVPTDGTPDHVAWPPRVILDLRSARESAGDHPLAVHGPVHRVPVLAAASPAAMLEHLEESASLTPTYLSMLEEAGARALVRSIEIIAEADGPVLVHCAAGKDRTGVVVGLALRLLDVDHEAVIAEYLRTNAILDALLERPALRDGAWADRLRLPGGGYNPLLTAEAMALSEVIRIWDEAPGGTRGWFTAQGGTPATIDALGRLLP